MEVTPTQAQLVNPAFHGGPVTEIQTEPSPPPPTLIPEPVPVPAHLEAAAALVTNDGIVAASQDASAPASPLEASIAALERRVAKLEGDHVDFFDRVKSAFGGKL